MLYGEAAPREAASSAVAPTTSRTVRRARARALPKEKVKVWVVRQAKEVVRRGLRAVAFSVVDHTTSKIARKAAERQAKEYRRIL